MKSMFTTETAVLVHFKSVGIILLVLHSVVVSLLAFAARKCDSNSISLSHSETPPDNRIQCIPKILSPSRGEIRDKKRPLRRGRTIIARHVFFVNTFSGFFPFIFTSTFF